VIPLTPSPYEHPLPALELDTSHLFLDSNNPQGHITIKNSGGGQLSGHILSRLSGLTFTPSRWEGNSQTITYNLSSDAFNDTSKTMETQAYICTNGGEIALPISISPSLMSIPTEEGTQITGINDFYAFAQTHPQAARRLFTSSEFYMLLLSTGYPFIEIYESLHKDPNRERAMDNFFMVSGLKAKTSLSLRIHKLNLPLNPTDKTHAHFYVIKSDSGYAEGPISTDAAWLGLSTTRLSSNDFDHENRAKVGITIDPALVLGNFARTNIQVGPEPANTLTLTVSRPTPLKLRLNREGYRYEDRGSIEIENNTGSDMTIDVVCRDRLVRFFVGTYTVGATHSIPFEIRPSAFASTRKLFRKMPYISTYVDIRARCPGQEFHRRLYLTIGEW